MSKVWGIEMSEKTDQDNAIIDRIIGERRSHRIFSDKVPAEDRITEIIHAGLHAPFAAAALENSSDYFRRFIVIPKNSDAIKKLIPLAYAEVNAMADQIVRASEKNPILRSQASPFLSRLEIIKNMGAVPGIGNAPFYIVAAERRGFPPIEHQSLSYCMENMWLKATALGLGFQLVSVTSQLAENPTFCQIVGLEPNRWAMMGCAIGYPTQSLSPSIRPPVDEVTIWLK